jgi:putative inorganic carbon (HCO3(-)) transporter
MGLVSIWQELTQSYSNHLLGFAQVDVTGFNVGSEATGEQMRPRLAGPIGEKNRYAQILLVLLPLAISLVRGERQRSLRIVGAACAVLIVSGAMLTFSRSAAIAIVLTVIAMAGLRMVALRHVVAIVGALLVLTLAVAPDYLTRIQSLAAAENATSADGSPDGAIQGRATEKLAAWTVFKEHPLLGVGPRQFFREYSKTVGNEQNIRFLKENRRAHNLYLEIAADTGALGLAVFLAIVGVTMVQLWRLAVFWRPRDRHLESMALGLVLALFAYLAMGIFLQLSYQRYLWFLIALANAAIWILRRQARAADAVT